ncbi:MAG: 6-phosphogluconolactonase [Jaaginema sp. PMC 1079.18]|nr:6-phosphogluconolactonase [Jaaginema sp. PMC 1080.18]MEC4851370.1 6-phosphogluconolactonase [Jaaginema sp. PMC 1079.18]MEC4868828.1 6-phosphogluconolactonase [Jaaginema sp. PMC 1078.18]
MDFSRPSQQLTVNDLQVCVCRDREVLAQTAAQQARDRLLRAVAQRGEAALVLATGNSQKDLLAALIQDSTLDWSKITLFHLDEFLGIGADCPGSFRFYLRDRVMSHITPRNFHFLQGDTDNPVQECDRYTALLQAQPLDLAFLGIGDNGHLAFNEPHAANFDDEPWVKVVQLATTTRQQQLGSSTFPNLEAVPSAALTLTFAALRATQTLICLAPGSKKAKIVNRTLSSPIFPDWPASYLRLLPQATLYVDRESYGDFVRE